MSFFSQAFYWKEYNIQTLAAKLKWFFPRCSIPLTVPRPLIVRLNDLLTILFFFLSFFKTDDSSYFPLSCFDTLFLVLFCKFFEFPRKKAHFIAVIWRNLSTYSSEKKIEFRMEQNMLCHFFFFSLFATEFKRLYITGTESIDRNKQTKRRTEQTRSHRAQARGREKKGERENEGDWDFVYIKGNILSYISINRNVTVRHATREKRKFMIADSFSLVGWFAYLFVCLLLFSSFVCFSRDITFVLLLNSSRKLKKTLCACVRGR